MKRLLINCEKLQTRAALIENGRLEDYEVERQGNTRNIVGAIYKGRVRNLEDSLQAAFVDIGLRKNAFLHYWDMMPASPDVWEGDDSEDSEENNKSSNNGAAESSSPPPKKQQQNRNNAQGENAAGDGDDESRPKRRRSRRRKRNNNSDDNGDDNGNNHSPTSNDKSSEGKRNRKEDEKKTEEVPQKVAITSRIVNFFKTCVTTEPEETEKPKEKTAEKDEDNNRSRQGDRKRRNNRGGNNSNDSNNQNDRNQKGGNQQNQQSRNKKGGDNRQDGGNRGNKGGDNRQDGGNRANKDGGNRGNKDGGNRGNKGGGKRRNSRPKVDISKIPEQCPVDSEVIVQITKGMIGEKGPRVTTNLSLPGRFLVLLPNSDHRGVSKRIENRKERTRLRSVLKQLDIPSGMGVICRTAAVGLDAEALQTDVEVLVDKWRKSVDLLKRNAPICIYREPDLAERMIRDLLSEGIKEIVIDNKETFEYIKNYIAKVGGADDTKVIHYDKPESIFQHFKITDQILDIFQRKVRLQSGAELCLDETEALIAIDINSGRSRGGKDHPETILNTNLEAAEEIARQLRLRNVGGLVVVDFIDMRSSGHRKDVYRRFKDALNRDRARTKVLPISNLGLLEMTRQREHESLQDSFFEDCHYCSGKGLVKSSISVSVEIQRALQTVLRKHDEIVPMRVMVHPVVLQRLKDKDSSILREMEEKFGGELSFRGDDTVHRDEFKIIDTRTGREIKNTK